MEEVWKKRVVFLPNAPLFLKNSHEWEPGYQSLLRQRNYSWLGTTPTTIQYHISQLLKDDADAGGAPSVWTEHWTEHKIRNTEALNSSPLVSPR